MYHFAPKKQVVEFGGFVVEAVVELPHALGQNKRAKGVEKISFNGNVNISFANFKIQKFGR